METTDEQMFFKPSLTIETWHRPWYWKDGTLVPGEPYKVAVETVGGSCGSAGKPGERVENTRE